MKIKFKGTTEQFVDWLRGNVRQDVWPKLPPEAELTVAQYDAWLQSIPFFVHTYPFEPPSSLDLPLRLEITARISQADPEEEGASLESDRQTIAVFEVCYPVPGGVLIEAECVDPAATHYFRDEILAKLDEHGWIENGPGLRPRRNTGDRRGPGSP